MPSGLWNTPSSNEEDLDSERAEDQESSGEREHQQQSGTHVLQATAQRTDEHQPDLPRAPPINLGSPQRAREAVLRHGNSGPEGATRTTRWDHLNMDVAITGSSGLIGTALRESLSAAGHRPIRLVRRSPTAGADEIQWDVEAGTIDAASLEGVGAVIHLAGAGIGDKRWNDSYKNLLLESRTKGTTLIAETLASLESKPSIFLSGSAIGYYGPRGDEVITEETPAGDTFLADLCVQWEASARAAIEAGVPTAFLRTGIVMTPKGGALQKQLPLFKLALGGPFGNGGQYQSWISLDDEVGAIIHLLDAGVTGPVNLTAPTPVTNRAFAQTLGKVLKRPAIVPVPAFGPRLLLGKEMANALLFESQNIVPTVLEASGYRFAHPDLETGLRAVLGK